MNNDIQNYALAYGVPIMGGSPDAGPGPGSEDQSIRIAGGPGTSASNPLYTTGGAGGGGLTDAELRATPVKVDDDETQTLLGTTNTNTGTTATGIGAPTDAEATGNGGVIAVLKRLRTILNGGLPAALAAGGGLKVEGVAGGVAQPASIADGSDANSGTTTDAANTTGTTGTISGKLRGIVTILADVWHDASNALRITPKSGSVAFGDNLSNTEFVVSDDAGNPMVQWAYPYLYDATNWDRARSAKGAANDNDGTGVAAAAMYGFDGSTFDRMPGTSAAGLFVQGAAADGAAVAGNPVRIAGKDGSGNTQDILTNTLGVQAVAYMPGVAFDSNAGEAISVKYANGVATASGDNTVLSAVTGKKIRVLGYTLQDHENTAGTPCTAQFQDNGTATGRGQSWKLSASSDGATQQGVIVAPSPLGQFETAEGVGLDLNLSAAIDVAWSIVYVEVE